MIHNFFVGDELDNWIKIQNWTLKEDGKVFICNQDAHIKSKNIAEKIDFDSKWTQCLSFTNVTFWCIFYFVQRIHCMPWCYHHHLLNLSSPKSDQHQFSQNNINRPFPHYAPVSKHKEMKTRLGWTISYKSLYFVHPSLELVPLFTGMRERSIHGQEKKSWELIIWPPMGKCCDLSSNSLNWFYKEKYGRQCGEFVCRYWGLKD